MREVFMPPKAPPPANHIYRFALYGVRSSGKTCILSALTLPRVAHPKSITCSWIENVPGHSLPSGDPISWNTDDPYHLGWRWIDEQRNRLRAGQLPAPNPNREDAMRFLFSFGAPDRGIRQVELIDYSGELLIASASELAEKLRDHMRVCDGILILAEVPYPGRDHAPLADDLERLKGAFLQLLNERGSGFRQDWPIALLFNKWDRRPNAESNDHGREKELLDAFLGQSPPPPHASLVDMIRNAVGMDNTFCWPVSAFGEHEIQVDGAEVPRLDGPLLKSRGLEDGFIWAADRCDTLRIEQLEKAGRAASWWAFPQLIVGVRSAAELASKSAWSRWLRGVSTVSGVSSSWAFRRRYARNSDLRRRATGALQTFGTKAAIQMLIFVGVVVVFVIGAETIYDGVKYRDIVATSNDPAAMPEHLERGENWLKNYFSSPGYRHSLSEIVILERSKAYSQLVAFRTRRDESAWKTVQDADNPATQVLLARSYVKTFPAGLHHSEGATLVADADRLEWDKRNGEYLNQVALKIEAVDATSAPQLDTLHKLNEEVAKLPHPEVRSETTANRQAELRSLISKKQTKIAEVARQANWENFKQNYLALMRNKNVVEAAKELESRTPQGPELQGLFDDFAQRAPSLIRGKVQDALKGRSWQLARELARLCSDPNVLKRLSVAEIKELQKLGREIDEAEDRDLYAQIVRYKPQCGDQVEAYLANAPLKSMKSEVEQYRQYISKKRGPLELTLSLTAVYWHDDYWARRVDYFNDVTVQVKGEPLITASEIKSKPNTRSAQIGEGTLTAGLDETITIDVSIVAKYTAWYLVGTGAMSGGSGSWTGTPSQLRSGVTIDLNGDGFTNRATFSLIGIPPEPPLPDWKSQ